MPPGFVVTTAGYDAFVRSNDLADSIRARLPIPDEPEDSARDAAESIGALFERHGIPTHVADAIRHAYREMGRSPAVAVRSSATMEDLDDASAAGQYGTFLNVRGEDAVLNAVRRCWASLWGERAIAYRSRARIHPATVGMAVIVQTMVRAEAAGVLFTVNPVSGSTGEVVLNGVWGLGDAVVSGRVTPDAFIVAKASSTLLRTEVAEKAVMSVCADSGVEEIEVDADKRRAPCLSADKVSELASLGCDIEIRLGAPQDVEWAIADDALYVLQARPVTVYPPSAPVRTPDAVPGDDDWHALDECPPRPFDLWTRANVGEAWQEPVTPLTWAGIPSLLNEGIRSSLPGAGSADGIQWAQRFYGHVYFNEGALRYLLRERYGLPEAWMDSAIGSRTESDREGTRGFRPVRFLRALPTLLRAGAGWHGRRREIETEFAQADDWVREFARTSWEQRRDRELWEALRVVWVPRVRRLMGLHLRITAEAMASYGLLERLMIRWFHRRDLASQLISGLSDIRIAEIGSSLWEMARLLRVNGLERIVLDGAPEKTLDQLRSAPEAADFLVRFDEFLAEYGHRGPCECEWARPRWAETPEHVLELVAGYLRREEGINPPDAAAAQRRVRQAAAAWVEGRTGFPRRALFRALVERVWEATRLRDNGRHFVLKVGAPIRTLYMILARRWVERGWLSQPEDLFFLDIGEIEAILHAGDPERAGIDVAARVEGRRQAHAFWQAAHPPDVVGADGHPIRPERETARGHAVLTGIPASGGQAEGVARIVQEPGPITRLDARTVLVAHAADPGWTPVFPLVQAIVLEVGGQLSHGAIVAREYGIPAVVNVSHAMSRIRDGQTVRVDGSQGEVYLDEDPLDETTSASKADE